MGQQRVEGRLEIEAGRKSRRALGYAMGGLAVGLGFFIAAIITLQPSIAAESLPPDLLQFHLNYPILILLELLPFICLIVAYRMGRQRDILHHSVREIQDLKEIVLRNEKTERLLERRTRELRSAQDSVKQQASLLDQVISAFPDRVYMTNCSGEYRYVSHSEALEWGMLPEDMIGKTWHDLGLLPDVMKLLDQHQYKVMTTGTPSKNEISFSAVGSLRHYEYILNPIFNDTGSVRSIVTTVRDITEQKESENALRQSEARLFKFMESIPVGVYVTDSEGTPYYANRAAQEILGGASLQSHLVEPISAYSFDQQAASLVSGEQLPIRQVLEKRKQIHVEDIEVSSPGGVVPLEIRATPIFNGRDNVEFAVATFQDISERKAAANLALMRVKEEERDRMLRTINEGLFILSAEGKIGRHYSDALDTIFNSCKLGGKSLFAFLEDKVPEKVFSSARDYIKLMFNARVKEKLIQSVNPLSEVEVCFDNGAGEFEYKFLGFRFQRIEEDNQIGGVLVSVNDITRQVQLAQKLQSTEEKTRKQMELMLGIIHIEPVMLGEFMTGAVGELSGINQELRARLTAGQTLHTKLRFIARAIHTIKGNASLIGSRLFEQKCHEFEDEISRLDKKPDLGGKDFLPLVTALNDLHDTIDRVKAVAETMARFGGTFRARRAEEWNVLIKYLKKMVGDISAKQGKKAELKVDNFDPVTIPTRLQAIMKDVLSQLVRNAITHGIESTERRKINQKDPAGRLEIFSQFEGEHFIIRFRDDGHGLSFNKLRQQALISGKWERETINSWSLDEVADLIFEPGFSTRRNTDVDGGRGFGMDIIRSKVESCGGKITVDARPGRYCEFTLRFLVRAAR